MTYICCFFFFNDTATTEIYTLSLHDALPISVGKLPEQLHRRDVSQQVSGHDRGGPLQPVQRHLEVTQHLEDRKSTRLNSSHANISYAVFCLKKKKKLQAIAHSLYFLSNYQAF